MVAPAARSGATVRLKHAAVGVSDPAQRDKAAYKRPWSPEDSLGAVQCPALLVLADFAHLCRSLDL